jgi:hypothetical protein
MKIEDMTREEAIAECARIDAKFAAAKHWGSWMATVSNDRKQIADRFGLPHANRITRGGKID